MLFPLSCQFITKFSFLPVMWVFCQYLHMHTNAQQNMPTTTKFENYELFLANIFHRLVGELDS